jgi:hypothetical protein
MRKIFIIFALFAIALVGISGCGGGSAGSSSNPPGGNDDVPEVVQLVPSHTVAQTNSTVYLHVQVLNGNGQPMKNVAVTFTNLSEPTGFFTSLLKFVGVKKEIGTLSASIIKTDRRGIATAKLRSNTSGFVTVQAEVNKGVGQLRDKKTIFFGEISGPVTSAPTLDLLVDDGIGTFDQIEDFQLFKGGSATDNQRTIKAVILDGSGTPMQGVTVTFGSDSPAEVTFTPTLQTAVTNANGEAFILVTVNPAILTNLQRVLNITAQATANSTSLADVVSLFLQPVTVSSVKVAANPDRVAPNGTSTILASVKMLGSLPVPDGSFVSFETTCGAVTPFGQTTDGVATATFTAPSVPPSGPCTVTASIGGVSGTTNITVTTTLTVQPSTQTMNGIAGGTATFTIFGGASPYTVFSNDAAFPAVVAGNIFTVNVAPNSIPKTVTYTVRDSLGTSVTATLTIAGGTSLAVLPSAVTVDSSAPDDTITFTVFGGVAPYSVFSNNPASFPPSTPTVASNGGAFTVTVPADAPSGSVILTIRDSGNPAATATATITISKIAPQPLIVIPSTRSIGNPVAGNTANFTILGGKAPYKAFSNNAALVTVPEDAAGNTVTITVASVPSIDTTVTITIFDSLGDSVAASLILDVAPILPLAVIPTTQTISNPTVGNTAQYQVTGGTGGYTAFSNNPALATATVAGNVVTATVQSVPSTDTTVTFTIYDSAASTISATLTLDVAPAQPLTVLPNARTISGETGGARTFTIFGGVPGYTVTSSNPSIAFDSGSGDGDWSVANSGGSITVNVPANIPASSVTLTVRDQAGTSTTATLTITTGPTLTVQPGSQIINGTTGGVATYTIFGGVPGYTVASSNPAIAFDSAPGDGNWTVGASGGTFAVTVPALSPSGAITLSVRDSAGTTQNATLTIAAPTTTLSITPTTFTIGTTLGGTVDIQYFASGGAAPYQVFFTLPVFVDPASPTQNTDVVGTIGDNNQEFIARYVWNAGDTATFQLIVVDSLGAVQTSTITMAP